LRIKAQRVEGSERRIVFLYQTWVTMNFQTMALLDEYFVHADRYLPERWLKGEGDCLRPANNFVMLPFGHGSRMCIGRRFAEQETWLALIKVRR